MTGQLGPALALAPVRGRDRIAVLDALRGFAILGIFYLNVPAMAGPISAFMGDIRAMGWTPLDQQVWLFMTTFLEGTQRGMLELLFGAGLMVTEGETESTVMVAVLAADRLPFASDA